MRSTALLDHCRNRLEKDLKKSAFPFSVAVGRQDHIGLFAETVTKSPPPETPALKDLRGRMQRLALAREEVQTVVEVESAPRDAPPAGEAPKKRHRRDRKQHGGASKQEDAAGETAAEPNWQPAASESSGEAAWTSGDRGRGGTAMAAAPTAPAGGS